MPDLFVIDPNGFLQRSRKDKLTPQFCPVASPNMTIRCGDWCPHFGEPVYKPTSQMQHAGSLTLTCQSAPVLTGIILDQRYAPSAAQPVNQPTINQEKVITIGN